MTEGRSRRPGPRIPLSLTPVKRVPYFCSGCPHNTSTPVPDGSLASGGIGCHTMVTLTERPDQSVLALVHDQARRLQAMADELEAVRASLNERRVIERAKGLLMAHRQLSEAEAHKTLRQMAMNQNRRLVDVAQAVLAMAEILPPGLR